MTETVTRTISGIVYILLLVTLSLFLPTFIILFAAFMLVAIWEFCNLAKLAKVPALIIGSLLFGIFAFFETTPFTKWYLVLATIIVAIKCIVFMSSASRNYFDLASKYVYLIGYVILPFVIITKLPFVNGSFDPRIIISIFIIIWVNDTFAYLAGKNFGRHKLFERVSPKKTIEGFAGGFIMALVASIVISMVYIQQSTWIWLVIAAIVSIFGTLGDLVESKFKRVASVKDSGTIMPGHGGILDRLDSIIFAAPFVFLFYQILAYVS